MHVRVWITVLFILALLSFGTGLVRAFVAACSLATTFRKTDEVRVYDQLVRDVITTFEESDPLVKTLAGGKVLCTTNMARIAELSQCIEVSWRQHVAPVSCRCFGDYVIECWAEGAKVCQFNYAHDSHLKRVPYTLGDTLLTKESRAALTAWIAANRENDPRAKMREIEHEVDDAAARRRTGK